MIRQRLVYRPSFPGHLTNQVCKKYKLQTCEEWDIVKYDISDANVRKKLNEFRFVCKIRNERWRVCLDKPGFCRKTERCLKKFLGFLKCIRYERLYLPVEEHQYLLDAGVVCKSY